MQLTIDGSREIAAKLLSNMPDRWSHVAAVTKRAASISSIFAGSGTLEIASQLHDIGYSTEIGTTGFHPLDGAYYLRSLGAPMQVVNLVANHSSAAAEAQVLGRTWEMAEFRDERTITRDLLWYFDMTTGPNGQRLSFDERMAEVRERYPADHYVIQALDLGMSERVAAVERATAWLSSAGLNHV